MNYLNRDHVVSALIAKGYTESSSTNPILMRADAVSKSVKLFIKTIALVVAYDGTAHDGWKEFTFRQNSSSAKDNQPAGWTCVGTETKFVDFE